MSFSYSLDAISPGSSFRLEIALRCCILARSILSCLNAGCMRTSANTARAVSKSSLRDDAPALPEVSPIPVSTEAAICSSRVSIWSPVLEVVPPVRMTSPVMSARPALSAGS